jgi:tetratricopeptide (TPR) repeat protein
MKHLVVALSIVGVLFSCKQEKTSSDSESAVQRVSYSSTYDSLTQLISNEPANAALYAARSANLLKLEKYNPAMVDIDKAIELDSINGAYYVQKAEILIDQKEIGKAKMMLDDAVKVTPGSTEVMLKIAEIYLWAGDYQKTMNWANAALGFDEYLAEAYYLKGMAHEYSKDTLKAVSSFQTAVEQDASHYLSYMQLGKLYAIEKHELAEAYFSNAIIANEQSIEAYYARGLHRQNVNNAKGAIQDYERIIELEPNHVAAHYNIGYVRLILMEQVDSAQYYFEKAFTAEPSYSDAQYMWGYCLELQGDKQEAVAKYKKVLAQDDTHSLAAKGLNRLTE